MTKEKTARVIPNAIQICTKEDRYFFTSFGTRDKTFLMLERVWKNGASDQVSHMFVWQMASFVNQCLTQLCDCQEKYSCGHPQMMNCIAGLCALNELADDRFLQLHSADDDVVTW